MAKKATDTSPVLSEPGNALATRSEAALDVPRAPEDFGAAPLSLPRIVLLQSLSAEVTREEESLKAGFLYNRLTKSVEGKAIDFIPFRNYTTRLRMVPSVGLACRSETLTGPAVMEGGQTADGTPTDDCRKCVFGLWPNERKALGEHLEGKAATSGPECSVVENFWGLKVVGEDPTNYEWVVLQFMRTSSKAAQDLKGLWKASNKDIESFVYRLTVRGDNKNGLAFFKQEIGRVRPTTADELAQVVKTKAFLQSAAVTTNDEDLDEPVARVTVDASRTDI